jgi:hypothetical protein
MTQPVRPACAAGVSEVVPTVALTPFWAEMTSALVVGFTSLLTSFPQLNARRGRRSGRMNNFTPPVPLHSVTHSPRSRGHAVIGVATGGSQICHDDQQRDHRRAGSRTSDDAAGTAKCARAYVLTDKGVAAVGTSHQTTRPLDTPSASTSQPDQQPITIENTDEHGYLEHRGRRIVDNAPPLTEAQRGRRATLRRLHAAATQAQQESQCHGRHVTVHQHPSAAADAARTEGRHR